MVHGRVYLTISSQKKQQTAETVVFWVVTQYGLAGGYRRFEGVSKEINLILVRSLSEQSQL
jgi:hypothetical protein